MPLPIVVLISGSGSNLQAIIDAVASGRLPVEIRAVISNRPGVKGLERAQQSGIPTEVLDHHEHASREAFDKALQACIDAYEPRLVVLAGFMRLLTDAFVNHYAGRMLNIHPSLLPNFKGLNTHQRALEAYHQGETTEHGASVHFVTPDLDGGPIILQASVPIRADDTPESLAARVLMVEHQIYPQAIQWFAEGRLTMQDHHAVLDGKVLDTPVDFH
jgi:phosphoribosylglycinamide formyltransferase-1